MFFPWIKRSGKAISKAEGITKGSAFAIQKAIGINLSNEIRINETEADHQKEAFVNPTLLRLPFSILMSGNKMQTLLAILTLTSTCYLK